MGWAERGVDAREAVNLQIINGEGAGFNGYTWWYYVTLGLQSVGKILL
jgi:hypothetical protein